MITLCQLGRDITDDFKVYIEIRDDTTLSVVTSAKRCLTTVGIDLCFYLYHNFCFEIILEDSSCFICVMRGKFLRLSALN